MYSKELFNRIYPIINYTSLKDLNVNKSDYISTLIKRMCFYPSNVHHQTYFKDQSNLAPAQKFIENYESSIQRHFYFTEEMDSISLSSINYLDSIINYCDLNNIQLSLITTPVHSDYFEHIPPIFTAYFKIKKDALIKSGIKVYDYSDTSYGEQYFIDADHLNKLGAEKLTKNFIQKIELTN